MLHSLKYFGSCRRVSLFYIGGLFLSLGTGRSKLPLRPLAHQRVHFSARGLSQGHPCPGNIGRCYWTLTHRAGPEFPQVSKVRLSWERSVRTTAGERPVGTPGPAQARAARRAPGPRSWRVLVPAHRWFHWLRRRPATANFIGCVVGPPTADFIGCLAGVSQCPPTTDFIGCLAGPPPRPADVCSQSAGAATAGRGESWELRYRGSLRVRGFWACLGAPRGVLAAPRLNPTCRLGGGPPSGSRRGDDCDRRGRA